MPSAFQALWMVKRLLCLASFPIQHQGGLIPLTTLHVAQDLRGAPHPLIPLLAQSTAVSYPNYNPYKGKYHVLIHLGCFCSSLPPSLLVLCREYIIPKAFDERVGKTVSKAVYDAAVKTGVARI